MPEFSLPTTLTILMGEIGGKHIVHCLDFDLLETAATEEDAAQRLRCTIKTYVEFGLSKGWAHCLRHRAPQRFWDVLTPNLPVEFGRPLEIANVALNEHFIGAENRALHLILNRTKLPPKDGTEG